MRTLEITRPDDWHVHLRDGPALRDTVRDVARYFGRAIVMPNLTPPVTTLDLARAYRTRIAGCIPEGSSFTPLMTLYLTDRTPVQTIRDARASGEIAACKLYPAGATTHADAGVTDIEALYPLFEEMARQQLPLLVHGEVTDPAVDVFDRESVFIERHLQPLTERIPELRVVFEHITTREAVRFVHDGGANVGATITAHHLLHNRNDLFAPGLSPLYFCLPVLKREPHRAALLEAATSGNPRFFLGTDSAPHPRSAKERATGCAAGIYTEHAALELYAEAFDAAGALDRLEGFASHHGADFYALPRNEERIRLTEESWQVEPHLALGDDTLIPLRAGERVGWRVAALQ